MSASRALGQTAAELKGDVLTACANIALDLGAADTWSQLGDVDAAVSNEGGTGAFDVAATLVEQAIVAGQRANANVALSVSAGRCRYDFEAQAACDAQCAANATCDAGTVETRCEPGELSVICSAACSAGSACEGRIDRPANCMGQCEAECQGECRGTANPICEPPIVKIFADITVAPQMEPVARTLEANLPPLLTAAEERGEDLLASVRELATVGEDLAGRIDSLDGHSLACVGASSLSLADALGHFDVSVNASIRVSAAVRVNAE